MSTEPKATNGYWKLLAMTLLGANVTGITGWLLFGVDTVKHSQIDMIMQTRAPYLHDKPRLDERLQDTKSRLEDLENRVRKLEQNTK